MRNLHQARYEHRGSGCSNERAESVAMLPRRIPQWAVYNRGMESPAQYKALLDAAATEVGALFTELHALYVFGSIAEGTARADSDLDLAILCPAPIEPLRRFNAQRELGLQLRRDVDLVDLLRAGNLLRLQVVEHGQLLIDRNTDAILEFEARVLSEYVTHQDATRSLRDVVMRDGMAYAP